MAFDLTIGVTDQNLNASETAEVSFSFTGPVTGFDADDITVVGGTIGAITGSGDSYSTTFTPSAGSTSSGSISVDYAGISDVDGAGSGSASSPTINIDTVAPAVAISSNLSAMKAGDLATIAFTFSEAPAGFDMGDITVAGGSISGFTTTLDPNVYTATFAPAVGQTGTASIAVAAGSYTDQLGNLGGAGSTPFITYDTELPTVAISMSDTALKIGETSVVTFTFSEAVTGFTTADVNVPNGALTGLSSSDGGESWTATYTPTAGVTDTSNAFTLDSAQVVDLAGNPGEGNATSANYTIDTNGPTATIAVDDENLTAGGTSLVTFTFSEAVTGFNISDATAANGTLSGLATSDNITWTATFTAADGVEDDTNAIALDTALVADGAGNQGAGTATSNNYAIGSALTATIVLADPVMTAGGTSLVTFTFSEAVTEFDNSDLTVENGSLSAVQSTDGVTWTATFTAGSVDDDTNVISLDLADVEDAGGDAGAGVVTSNNYEIDLSAPPPPPSEDDQITLPPGGGAVEAGPGDDRVVGDEGLDTIQGNIGNDVVTGGGGADVVRGGQGSDFVHGNVGADLVFGDLGDDSVFGGQDDDFAHGGSGADYVVGDLGDDAVLGGQGSDTVVGGDGADYLSGDLGDDVLLGGAGADLFNFQAGGGRDIVMDFSSADGDLICISRADAADFAALSATFVADPAGTVIQLGAQAILVVGLAPAALSAGDFAFV
ncbi:MAG TPA: Ig-like domain-containing protein [Phenylobacterium sp.]|uniref:Ig-like domain-containing protein n=1 Tax=Phenylobacterium sp. TaxID=1871053 RepID=UPI002F93D630